MRQAIKDIVSRLMPGSDDAVVVDFETYYDEECSVKTLGNWAYTAHPRFDAYLVTIFGSGVDYVGHASEAPWDQIKGRVWLAHNAGFDAAVHDWCVRMGAAPKDAHPSKWVDTADLASFLGYNRNLQSVARNMFSVELDKVVRDEVMKGRYWHQFGAEDQQRILDYAGDDAIAWCIWQQHRNDWPEFEQALSQHTFLSARRGVCVDQGGIDQDIQVLKRMQFEIQNQIPWFDDVYNGKPVAILSRNALQRECDKAGVPFPETTSLKEQSFLDWLDEYGEKVPAVYALTRYRRLSRQLSVYEAMRKRVKPDGRLDAGLKYYGAEATGRWAGVAGVNLQNFLKTPIYADANYQWIDSTESAQFVIDIRSRLIPAPGKKFVIADESQIEPRCLNWFVGNKSFLEFLRAGQSPYEAHARASMGWTGGNLKKENPALYALAKARVLALGYCAGWRRFIDMAAGYVGPALFKQIFEAPVTAEEEADFLDYLQWLAIERLNKEAKRDLRVWATGLSREEKNVWVNSWIQVTSFRADNRLFTGNGKKGQPVGIWKALEDELRGSIRDRIYELPLPSGRSLRYFDISDARGGLTAKRTRGGKPERVYGGHLTENLTQAIARDVFGFAILNLEKCGYPVVFHVHDEAICEVDESVNPEDVLAAMKVLPDWAAGLVVDVEGGEARYYKK